jgi:hypothetical protein
VLAHESHVVFMLEDLENSPKLKVIKGRRIRRGVYGLHFEAQYGTLHSQAGAIYQNDVPKTTPRNYHPD